MSTKYITAMKNSVAQGWKNVLRVLYEPRSAVTASFVAILYMLFSVFLSNVQAIFESFSGLGFVRTVKLFLLLVWGYAHTVTLASLIATMFTAILFGVLSALIIYKATITSPQRKRSGVLGSIAALIGVLAPGCAACGIGLFSALGIGGVALSFLPFGGIELSVLSIGVLIYSVIYFAKSIDVCPVRSGKA